MSEKNNFIDVQSIMEGSKPKEDVNVSVKDTIEDGLSKKEAQIEQTEVKVEVEQKTEPEVKVETKVVSAKDTKVKEKATKKPTSEKSNKDTSKQSKPPKKQKGNKENKQGKDDQGKPKKLSTKKKVAIIVASVVVLAAIVVAGITLLKGDIGGLGNESGSTSQTEVHFQEKFTPVDDSAEVYEYAIDAKNNTNKKYYLRVKVGSSMEDKTEVQWIESNINKEYWEYKDGYCYYKDTLEGNKTSENVFKGVKVDNAFLLKGDNGGETVYMNSGEFIKSGHYKSAEEAFKSLEK